MPQSELIPGGWDPLQLNQTRYLSINAENPSMVNQPMPFDERIKVLNKIVGRKNYRI